MKDQSVIVKAFEFLFPYHFSFIQYESVRSRTSVRYESIRIDTNAGGMHWVLYVDVDEQTSSTILCNPMLWSVSLISLPVRCCDVLLCEVAGT